MAHLPLLTLSVLPMPAVYTGTGPVKQKDNAMRPNDFNYKYYKAVLPDMLMRGGKVLDGGQDAVCFVD